MSGQEVVSEAQIDKAAMLRQVPLFAGLPEETIDQLARVARVSSYPEGDEILEEGAEIDEEAGDGMYLLINGTVEVRKDSTDGTDGHLLARLGPGEFFGEMALLDDQPRSASVFAKTDVLCLGLNRWDFLRHLRSNPETAIKMLAVLSRRLRRQNEAAV